VRVVCLAFGGRGGGLLCFAVVWGLFDGWVFHYRRVRGLGREGVVGGVGGAGLRLGWGVVLSQILFCVAGLGEGGLCVWVWGGLAVGGAAVCCVVGFGFGSFGCVLWGVFCGAGWGGGGGGGLGGGCLCVYFSVF